MTAPRTVPAKLPTTVDEQLATLRRRGMLIQDEPRARQFLEHINYYRLRGYWMAFELSAQDGEHPFQSGTSFRDVIDLYDFDRRLRLELNDAIERFEVSLRTHWAYELAHWSSGGGTVAHRNPDLFNEHHRKLLKAVEQVYEKRNEPFLERFLGRDEEPPVWVACELFSLSDLSKWYRSIRWHQLRQRIADPYGLHERAFASFVEQMAFIRNVCAHHGRLYNRSLVVGTMALPRKPTELVQQLNHASRAIYNPVALMAWCMCRISPGSEWTLRMRRLIEERPDLWPVLGMPDDWQRMPLWRHV